VGERPPLVITNVYQVVEKSIAKERRHKPFLLWAERRSSAGGEQTVLQESAERKKKKHVGIAQLGKK